MGWRCALPQPTAFAALFRRGGDQRVAQQTAGPAQLVWIRAVAGLSAVPFGVGVAGLHRLTSRLDLLRSCRVLIVVAGMEGALPSVVGGLLSKPIVAVPTHIGYGSNFGGISALLSMLNSCVPGITVVNIDNGFGAGVAAALSVKHGQALTELNMGALQQELLRQGVRLQSRSLHRRSLIRRSLHRPSPHLQVSRRLLLRLRRARR